MKLEGLAIDVRVYNCLIFLGITDTDQLSSLTRREILSVKNFGKKSLAILESEMKRLGVEFRRERCPTCNGRGTI